MPSHSRASQLDLGATPYYHCISRCVRRAFLCGEDPYSGKSFEHRKGWVVERLRSLSAVFAVDVCAYAVMSNHFHLVVRVDAERAAGWSDDEVAERWSSLFKLSKGQLDSLTARDRVARVALWRSRLSDLSWMMRSLNEHIARRANKEDECTGRFWEGRFKSQPLMDEAAVLTCMAYVDLNPVRAGLCTRLDEAEFTSIEARLREVSRRLDEREDVESSSEAGLTPTGLLPFADQALGGDACAVPMLFLDYVELLEWTGRARRQVGPGGRLRGRPPSVVGRLGLSPEVWLQTMRRHGLRGVTALGRREALEALARRQGKRWVRGQGFAKRLFVEAA